MSETEHVEHAERATTTNLFTDAELAGFLADDKKAATNFVSLMLGIFLAGVILYSIVAYICAQ